MPIFVVKLVVGRLKCDLLKHFVMRLKCPDDVSLIVMPKLTVFAQSACGLMTR